MHTIHSLLENTTGNPIITMMFVAKYILLLRRQLAIPIITMMFVAIMFTVDNVYSTLALKDVHVTDRFTTADLLSSRSNTV